MFFGRCSEADKTGTNWYLFSVTVALATPFTLDKNPQKRILKKPLIIVRLLSEKKAWLG
jgi:TRAP-type mannitol/chloroaromatic compound transport system permease small subunit